MLYLIKLDNAYKIGYTKDVSKRIKDLGTTHLIVELLSTKLGNKKDEKALHNLCKEYRIKNELFLPYKEVENLFNKYISANLKEQITDELKKYIEVIKIYDIMMHKYEELLQNKI